MKIASAARGRAGLLRDHLLELLKLLVHELAGVRAALLRGAVHGGLDALLVLL